MKFISLLFERKVKCCLKLFKLISGEESFKFNLIDDPKSRLLQLPDYLIENYIFPYISGKELFLCVRRVHPYLHEIVKNSWGNSIKEEMFSQLKNLALIYEKDALTKAYEFKLQYLN